MTAVSDWPTSTATVAVMASNVQVEAQAGTAVIPSTTSARAETRPIESQTRAGRERRAEGERAGTRVGDMDINDSPRVRI
jgi:hypothetical protein